MAGNEFKSEGLDKFIKSLGGKLPKARVGILGPQNARTDGALTNAEIGATHEFGDSTHPMRSFLRMPLTDYLKKYLDNSGAFDPDAIKQVIKDGSLVPWVQKVSNVALEVVLEAFSTGGFGKWAPWKSPNYANNSNMVLVDTAQLRNSITATVVE